MVYPRVCGGTTSMAMPSLPFCGLSPRVRGNHVHWRALVPLVGSIPACAGEPLCVNCGASNPEVYPRVCGGTRLLSVDVNTADGLSPRVRGNLEAQAQATETSRSIPACAGEPALASRLSSPAGVYPRVCGGTGVPPWLFVCRNGLSPRVRGNHASRWQHPPPPRSIPACAGEPARHDARLNQGRVYPRVCGGTRGRTHPLAQGQGLSPRVRGNRRPVSRGCSGRGSIPACAGEPTSSWQVWCPVTVYPRVCGGTSTAHSTRLPTPGLSPRVRGNPTEPQRLCPHRQGLSPRVRGNPTLVKWARWSWGSIPACAGEPNKLRRHFGLVPVYPRVCGETISRGKQKNPVQGLSPRVRGNRSVMAPSARIRGSIPACAGKPIDSWCPEWRPTVYPRVCGETSWFVVIMVCSLGLSPRVRGNRWEGLVVDSYYRSIPACAGKPTPLALAMAVLTVYPRVCGETILVWRPLSRNTGLSPRVRGNLSALSVVRPEYRSIPACAGKPR